MPKAVLDGTARLRARESDIIVNGELLDSLWEEEFSTAEDKHVIEELRTKLKALGLDPNQAETIVKSSRANEVTRRSPTLPFAVQPHLQWQEARTRLNEQAKRVANILLNNVGLKQAGTEIPYKYKTLGVSANTNYVAALTMVNHALDKQLGKDRGSCTTEEFRAAAQALDEEILQTLVRRVKKAQSDYEHQNAEG